MKITATAILALTITGIVHAAGGAPFKGTPSHRPAPTHATPTHHPVKPPVHHTPTPTTTFHHKTTFHNTTTGATPFKTGTTGTTAFKSGTTGTGFHHAKPLALHKPPFVPVVKPLHRPGTLHVPGRGATGFVSTTQYAKTYGTSFSRGSLYKGFHHRHWTHRYWSPRWGFWTYYDPCCSAWYYYHPARAIYLPVTVINQYPVSVQPGETVPAAPNADDLPTVGAADTPSIGDPQPDTRGIE